MSRRKKARERKSAVTLRTIAQHVGLAPCSVSAVLNDSAAARKIPQRTKNRVVRAAMKLNYRPNFSARALRTRRTRLVAVVATDLSSTRAAGLIAGIERCLREEGYLLVLGGWDPHLETDATARVMRAGVEGVIVIDGVAQERMAVPFLHVSTRVESGGAVAEELTELGVKAARSIVVQIEKQAAAWRKRNSIGAGHPAASTMARVGAA